MEHIQARPAAESASVGGTGPVAVIEPPAPAPPVGVAPPPGPVDAPPRVVPPRVARTRPALGVVAEPPRPIAQLAPRYPVALRESGVEGRVVATFVVDAEGWARDVEAQASHAAFAQAVREVLPRWRFEPARDAAGQAVAAPVRQVFRFRIED
ncbi:MAG: TonB family protein [Proteobacteria bacterium]|nr:TonB family protein [Pseudomonadota bacterium]